jgi:ribosomal protein S18 acetylase RimI-like enzyme
MIPCPITRRPAEESDVALLFELYAATREHELAMVPWNDDQKRAFLEMQFRAQRTGYAAKYPAAAHEIICLGERGVGRIYWSNEPERIHILDITIAPASRNAGIGSGVLHEILALADRDGKPVTIYVEPFNPSRRLFERIGFGIAINDEVNMLLERPAAPQEA